MKANRRNKLTLLLLVISVVSCAFGAGNLARYFISSQRAIACYSEMNSILKESEESDFPQIHWEALADENPEAVAWLYCPDTKLNLPVVQTTNNEFYLTHLPTGEYNNHGAAFMDAKNTGVMQDKNTIVYAHNMKDGTMFACLYDWKDKDFLEQHDRIYVITPEYVYTIRLVRVGEVDTESDVYDRTIPVDGPKYLTLSTCTADGNRRLVLRGVLIETEVL